MVLNWHVSLPLYLIIPWSRYLSSFIFGARNEGKLVLSYPIILVACSHFVSVIRSENITLLNNDPGEYSIINIVFGYPARFEIHKVAEIKPEIKLGHYASETIAK
jgi:hypothetical protein